MNKALFLDRDGTINIDHGYTYQIEKFDFIDGIFEACRAAQKNGYKIIVITNQSGIARGYYTEKDFEKITAYMCAEFKKNGVHIEDVFYCPFLDTEHPDRKPNPGMLLKAQEKHNIDMAASIMIGDSERDIEAGQRAGVGTNVLYAPTPKEKTKADYQISAFSEFKNHLEKKPLPQHLIQKEKE